MSQDSVPPPSSWWIHRASRVSASTWQISSQADGSKTPGSPKGRLKGKLPGESSSAKAPSWPGSSDHVPERHLGWEVLVLRRAWPLWRNGKCECGSSIFLSYLWSIQHVSSVSWLELSKTRSHSSSHLSKQRDVDWKQNQQKIPPNIPCVRVVLLCLNFPQD